MDPERYQDELAPLLDAMSPASRFMVKAMMDERHDYSIDLNSDN